MIERQLKDVPVFYALWLPVSLLIPLIYIRVMDEEFYNVWIDSELGVVEIMTPVILLVGIFFGIRMLVLRLRFPAKHVSKWLCLMVAACIYFAGEELSWGQHLFQWETPDVVGVLNDQNETNLHNISSWFDQKPRLLLEIWVLIGGVILPIRRHLNKETTTPENFAYWFWPSNICFPAAALVIFVKLPERINDLFNVSLLDFGVRHSEIQEFYFAIFLSIYLTSIYLRRKSF